MSYLIKMMNMKKKWQNCRKKIQKTETIKKVLENRLLECGELENAKTREEKIIIKRIKYKLRKINRA